MLCVSQTKSYSAQELLGQKARFFHYPKLLEFPLFGCIQKGPILCPMTLSCFEATLLSQLNKNLTLNFSIKV